MNYYPFHIGDYAAHTGHLEPMEDLAYRRLLDMYYLAEGPLPPDPAECARKVRMRDYVDTVASVLREFFVLTDDGWRHIRCDEEIGRKQDKTDKAKASAERRWKPNANPPAERTDSERNANAMRTHSEGNAPNSQEPIAKETHTPRATAVELAVAMRQAGVAANSANPQVIALAAQGVGVDTAVAACEEARKRLPGESVSVGYVTKILETWAKRAAEAHVNGATVPRPGGLTDDAIARIQAELEAEERNAAA